MIQVEQVGKKFPSCWALQDITLTIDPGHIFGLVGPDGAGKTTLLRLLTGVLDPSVGNVSLFGTSKLETVKGRIGYVPQKFSLYGDLSVMENIMLLGSLYSAKKKDIVLLAEHILAFTKLLPFKDRLADHLSGGMKQKLALAAGLMHKPDILFLDEPTTGVDPVSRREFWQMLYRLNQDGMTVVVSTPYMDEAELCSHIAFIHQGRILTRGTPKELCQKYPYELLELKASSKGIKRILQGLPIEDINSFGDTYHLVVRQSDQVKQFIEERLRQASIRVQSLRMIPPTLEDVFVALVSDEVMGS